MLIQVLLGRRAQPNVESYIGEIHFLPRHRVKVAHLHPQSTRMTQTLERLAALLVMNHSGAPRLQVAHEIRN